MNTKPVRPPNRMTLAETESGSAYRIVAIQGRGCAEHLLRMGLSEGAVVECVHNLHRGPVVVRYGRTGVAVGRGMAHRVVVELVDHVQGRRGTGGLVHGR